MRTASAEPVGERRVDVARLGRETAALGGVGLARRAQQPQLLGDPRQHEPRIGHDGEQHAPQRLGLRRRQHRRARRGLERRAEVEPAEAAEGAGEGERGLRRRALGRLRRDGARAEQRLQQRAGDGDRVRVEVRDDARDRARPLERRRRHAVEQLAELGGGAAGSGEGGLVVIESGCFHGGNARRERVGQRRYRYHTRPMTRAPAKPDAPLVQLALV